MSNPDGDGDAAMDRDRKVTESLVSGFDRRGRAPRKPGRPRDFVDYYAKRDTSGREARFEKPPETCSTDAIATRILPQSPWWRPALPWAGAILGMLLFGALVAFFVTPDEPPRSSPRAAATSPAADATITSAPLPAPVETTTSPTVIVVPSAPPARAGRRPRTAPSSAPAAPSTGAAPPAKNSPRDDFVRDL